MPKQPLCIAFLWHMHQPDYANEETGATYLPWARFHAVKDYFDMAALVEQVPGLHVTINVVPSLVDQLLAYAGGTANETYQALTLRPAEDLDEREKLFLLRAFFQLPWRQMILPYPRYKELLDRRGTPDEAGEFTAALKRCFAPDYRDLQVWFNLSWCGNELRRNPAIAELIRKGRDFSEADKARLLELQAAFIGRILPLYRRLLETHGVEISVSPYYHPILPLLINSRSAREALPDIALPQSSFSYPADAREQVARAMAAFARIFGQAPRGMWPSEGSISEAASALAGEAGLHWLASDEGVLLNSLSKAGRAGGGLRPEEKYRAWRHGSGPALFFRDHGLSDLIGFTYARWQAREAVNDFLRQLRRIHDSLPADGRHYIVPVILDGENAWEHYPQNGGEFLGMLYRSLVEADFLRTVTFSEYLDLEPGIEPLPAVVAGSWIYSCLATWIGHAEKNAAWEALTAARQAYTRLEGGLQDPAARDRALREIMIAEGSDWFWWYGDDHQSENAAEFDGLFRSHLKNVYRLLGQDYPQNLDIPIKKADLRTQYGHPVHTISPRIDGRVTDYFEWLSAGFATAGGGAMHQVVRYLEKVYFGYDRNKFYVRLDFTGGLAALPPEISVVLQFLSPAARRLTIARKGGGWECGDALAPAAAAAGGKILEVAVGLEALGIREPDETRLFISLIANGQELERFPSLDLLVVPVDPAGLNQEEWMV